MLTSPEFLIETEALKKEFEKLAAADRPSWPLQRPVRVASPPVESREAGPEIVDFVGHLKVHLDRWGLMKLVDWDLPEPQGPLFDDQLPLAAPASPTHGVRITLPLHYPLQGDDDLLRQIKEYQQQAMKDQGLPTHLAAIGNHEQFAQFFRVIHVETTLRSRWAEKAPPHAVGLIESAAAKVLEARIYGTPIEALCGHVWVPSRDPKQLPVCEKCKGIYEMYRAFHDGLHDTPKD